MVQFLPSEYSKVLEIGCNVGNFREFVSKPCEYWGIEPFEEAANVAKTKMDKGLVGFYDKVADEVPDNYFDLVIACDVLEHMEQPWNFLQSIKRKMTAKSSIVLSIPNVRYYDNLNTFSRSLLLSPINKALSANIAKKIPIQTINPCQPLIFKAI